MRTYTLTDRDFEEFYAMMESIEFANRMKHGHTCPTSPCKECDLLGTYRFHLIGWRNRVTSGDSLHRSSHTPSQDWVKDEIYRLKKLLPAESETV